MSNACCLLLKANLKPDGTLEKPIIENSGGTDLLSLAFNQSSCHLLI